MSARYYNTNLILCAIVSVAWLIPTLGALLELPLGVFQLVCFFMLWARRSSMDTRAKSLLSSYARMIIGYVIIVAPVVYYVIHNGVNLKNDLLEFLLVFLVLGLPMFFAWYFVYCLKYLRKSGQGSKSEGLPDVLDMVNENDRI